MKNKPNFLIFVADQLQSFCLGCNGNPDVKTPHIDKLAQTGLNFKRAYCSNPVCMPSRATMLTGMTPRQHGCITNGMKTPENIPTVTRALRESGYHTRLFGKLHLQPFSVGPGPLTQESHSWEAAQLWNDGTISALPADYYGFEQSCFVGGHGFFSFGDYKNWLDAMDPALHEKFKSREAYYTRGNAWRIDLPPELHYNNWIADRTMDYINSLERDDPFFLWCSFPDPHAPFAACKPYSEMYDPAKLTIDPTFTDAGDYNDFLREKRAHFTYCAQFDEDELREMMAQTYGMITHIDDNIGRVLHCLKEKGLREDTVVVFMADHGEYLGAHHLRTKAEWNYEQMVRVPFIWNIPANVQNQANERQVVSLLDFAPTVLELAGMDESVLYPKREGKSNRVGLAGRSLCPAARGELLAEKPALFEYDEDWHPGEFSRMRGIISGPYKLTLFANCPGGILIDVVRDPLEKENLYDDPRYAQVRAALTELLVRELARTDRLEGARICGA